MSEFNYGIGQEPFNDRKWSSGIAYICIPSDQDLDRDLFISECFNHGTVMMKNEEGGVYKNVPCPQLIFNQIEFPDKYEDYGTAICYVTSELHQQPLIVGKYTKTNEIIDQQEHEWLIGRKFKSSNIEIRGSAKEGFLNIVIDGNETSDLLIKIINKNNKGSFKLDIDGMFNIFTLDNIEFNSQKKIYQKVGNSKQYTETTQNNSELNHNVEKFSINQGSEAIPLGNILKDFLNSFIDEVSKSTVTTSLGQMPLLNSIQISKLKLNTDKILSKYSFTD